jgi:hypothetical protein
MSVASQNARPVNGMAAPNNLLAYMKLKAPSDPVVHEKISEWVAFQKVPAEIHSTKVETCRVSSALLLQRLVRAFENRLSSSSDDANRTKVPTVINSRTNSASPTNGKLNAQMNSPRQFSSRLTNTTKAKKKLPSLSVLMQRKVKVTQLVQQAVQFVGSDVLKVLQVSITSPTVADVAKVCLNILNDEHRIKDFYRIFSKASGKDTSNIDENTSIYFGVFALQALQSLRAQAISAYEFSRDFESIYRACYEDQSFQICMHELNPAMKPLPGITPTAFAPDTEARNICWKIARLLALKYDYSNKSDPEAKDHRRNHILISAASIILAANIGKSMKNCEFATGSTSAQKTIIPDDTDFITLIVTPVSELLQFVRRNIPDNQGITPVGISDIRSNVIKVCDLINQLGIGSRVTNNIGSSSSKSLIAKAFSPEKYYIFINDYRSIIQKLVTETQEELKITTAIANKGNAGGASVRTGIVNVLLFFPMVIGEPWGIHRDAPMITSKMLCSGENSKPSDPLKDSVAVVLKMKPRPDVIKRKAEASVPTANKKAKIFDILDILEIPKKKSNKVPQETIDLVGEVSTSPVPAPRAPILVRVGEIEAPMVDDASEVNEWTLSILSLSVIKPTDTLLTFLGENDRTRGAASSCLQDVIVPVLNRGVLRIQSTIRSSSNAGSEVINTKLSIGRRDGQVYVNGLVDQNIQLYASVVGFYYYSLEAIIQDQMERMDFLGSFGSQLRSGSFHRALFACCYSCILKGVGINQKLQINRSNQDMTVQALMDTTESDSFTFLKVIEGFCRALVATKGAHQKQLGFPIVPGLPVILYKQLQKVEVQLIDSVLWNASTTSEASAKTCFALSIKTMKNLPGAWPPDILEPMLPEEIADVEGGDSSKSIEVRCKPAFSSSSEANFLSFVLRKLLKFTFFRIRAICAALNLSNENALHTQILVAFRYLLRHHMPIFIDRHVDQLLLCTFYGVCRVMKIQPKISFGKVIDAYFTVRGDDLGDRACRIIVRHVKLAPPGDGNRSASRVVGNIVVFYNTVYIPKMQKYFLGSKSLKKSAESYQTACEKDEKSKKNQIPEKKDAAGRVPKKSSDDNAGAVVAAENLGIGGSGDKKLNEKNAADPSSLKRKDSVPDSINLGSTKIPTSLNSVEKVPGTNGTSPMVGKPTKVGAPNPTLSPFVAENRTVNGTIFSGAKEVDSRAKLDKAPGGNSPVVVGENGTSASRTANAPEKSVITKPGASSSKNVDKLPLTELDNDPMDVVVETDKKKETKSASPSETVRAEQM